MYSPGIKIKQYKSSIITESPTTTLRIKPQPGFKLNLIGTVPLNGEDEGDFFKKPNLIIRKHTLRKYD